MQFQTRPIILASKSPRRSQLLTEAGFEFTIKTKDVPEDYPADMPVVEVAEFLAQKKANACRSFIEANEILLSADSVVILKDTIYEKPKDEADAKRILRELSGQVHRVITGVCLISENKTVHFSGTSKVYLEVLTEAEIDYYVTTFQPFDKAGAYAIQEWIGLCKISKIEGTYSNIMGLPVEQVYRAIVNWDS